MLSKNWINIFIIFNLIMLFVVCFVNYYIDPLLSFNHKNEFNQVQKPYDERLTKTNYIKNNELNEFNGLLFGSSRTTHIYQTSFLKPLRIFNYATASMDINEYEEYIEFAKKNKRDNFKYILIGLDFFNTNKYKNITIKKPSYYIDKVSDPLFKYKSLVSIDLLKKSINNIKYSMKLRNTYYDRSNNHKMIQLKKSERIENQRNGVKFHFQKFIGNNFLYDEEYVNTLYRLKDKNKNSEFIIFTSPITSELLFTIINDGKRLNEYKRWLRETVSVFGEIYHFMYFNDITTNLENYPDSSHYYPHVGSLIAEVLSTSNLNSNINFGVKLNNDNIDQFFKLFTHELVTYKKQ